MLARVQPLSYPAVEPIGCGESMSLDRSKGALGTLRQRISSTTGLSKPAGDWHVRRAIGFLLAALCTSVGCATAGFHHTQDNTFVSHPSRTPFRVSKECAELHAELKRPDDMPTGIWQETAAQHLRKCGKFITFDHLNALTRIPTVRGDRDAMLLARTYLSGWASAHHIDFSVIGDDILWSFEIGSGGALLDMIAHLDIPHGGPTLPLTVLKHVPAHQATLELDRIYGRGVRDNKIGIAAGMALLETLAQSAQQLSGGIRLIVVPQSHASSSEVSEWATRLNAAKAQLVLDSNFPVSLGSFGSGELNLTLGAVERRSIEKATWNIIALGAGQNPSRTPSDALIVLQLHPALTDVFDEVVRDVGSVAEATLEAFGDAFSLELQPLIDRGQLGLRIRGKDAHAAEPDQASNPLLLLAAIATQLDIKGGHGRAALEFIAHELSDDHRIQHFGIPSKRGVHDASLAPTILRYTDKEATLRLFLAYPGVEPNLQTHLQTTLTDRIQSTLWSTVNIEQLRESIDGTSLQPSDPRVLIATQIAQAHFPDASREPSLERFSTLLPLFPGALGFGPSLGHDNSMRSVRPESVSVKLLELWPIMLLEFAAELDSIR